MDLDLIRSPLLRVFSDADDATKTQESWNVSFYFVVTNHNEPLEAVDRDMHGRRYDMVLESCWRPSQIGPHQVTYDAVAWPIHIQRA